MSGYGRCDNCGRATRPRSTPTSWVPGVTICDRANCERVAELARRAYIEERNTVVAFGFDDRPIRVEGHR